MTCAPNDTVKLRKLYWHLAYPELAPTPTTQPDVGVQSCSANEASSVSWKSVHTFKPLAVKETMQCRCNQPAGQACMVLRRRVRPCN